MNVVELELPLFPVPCDWKAPDLSSLPSWKYAKRVAVDVETRDDSLRDLGPGVRRGAYITGISFAIEDGPGAYLPYRHFGGDNLDGEQVLRYVRDNAKVFKGTIVGANLPYDLDFMAEEDVKFSAEWFRDVQVADPLIYELHQSYSLENIALRWGFEGKQEDKLREAAKAHGCDAKSEMWKLPARYVGEYAEQDTRLPLKILRKQEDIIRNLGLDAVYDLESKVLPILVKMRRRGVIIDQDRLERIETWSLQKESECCKQVYTLTGRHIGIGDVNKAAALAPILREIGVVLPRTKKTDKDSIDKVLLGGLTHPVGKAILQARKYNKLRTTFAQSIRKYMTKGRIHATFNQLRGQRDFEADGTKGAAWGRLSCSDPNLQQQPSRDEFAAEWRSIYLPEEGKLWASCDYSQQEPRMAIHFAIAAGPGRIGQEAYDAAVQMAARYRDDASTDFHNMVVAMTGNRLGRKDAKVVGLGTMYGMGQAKMCDAVGVPLSRAIYHFDEKRKVYADEEPEVFSELISKGGKSWIAAGAAGRKILEEFDKAVPFIKALATACQAVARERGDIRTLYKRICHFPEKTAPGVNSREKYEWLHKALNRVIQGSSGDQTKEALVKLDEAGFFLQLQVHDEVTLSVADEKEAQAAARVMESAVPLHVTMRCDVEVGPSWGGSMS